MTGKDGEISIWFFIGLALVVNGALICGAGVYELVRPPATRVVLYELNANLWWGALLLVLGAVYCRRFRPSAQRQLKQASARSGR
jgi:hypothetical protein